LTLENAYLAYAMLKIMNSKHFISKKIMITSGLCSGVYSGVRRFLITPTL